MRRLPLLSLQVQPVPGVSNYGQVNLALRSASQQWRTTYLEAWR